MFNIQYSNVITMSSINNSKINPSKQPRVIVGILSYKSKKYITHCLKSVLKQTYSNIKVVVLNNHSPDSIDKTIKTKFSKVKLIKSNKNLGFAKGHNQIWRTYPDDLYLCLNVDIILEPNFIAELVNLLKSHPKAGAVSGKILRWDFKKKKKTKQIDTAGLKLHSNHQITDIGAGKRDTGKYDGNREVFGVSGAVFLIRPDVMEELGGFDERMFMYKEDVDLMYRMQWLGYKCFMTGKAMAYHDRTHAKGSVSPKVRGMSFVHHRIMLRKNLSPNYPKFILRKTRWYEFKKGVYTFFTNYHYYREWQKIKKAIKPSSKKAEVKELLKWIN